MSNESTDTQGVSTHRFPAVYLPATPALRSDRLNRLVRRVTRRRGPIGWDRRSKQN